MALYEIVWRIVSLALAGACGVFMAYDWTTLGILCAMGATYAIHTLVETVRRSR